MAGCASRRALVVRAGIRLSLALWPALLALLGLVAAARAAGVLGYSGTGTANGADGDQLLLGPPFVVTDAELDRIVEVVSAAIELGTAAR